jgi:hypothetical protein
MGSIVENHNRKQQSHGRTLFHCVRLAALTQWLFPLDFDLAVGPTWDLHHEIDHVLLACVGIEWDVMPEGGRLTISFEPDAPVL